MSEKIGIVTRESMERVSRELIKVMGRSKEHPFDVLAASLVASLAFVDTIFTGDRPPELRRCANAMTECLEAMTGKTILKQVEAALRSKTEGAVQ